MSELKTMFRLTGKRIQEFTVIKETDKQLTFINEYGRESREAKDTNYQSWHRTVEEAIKEQIKQTEDKIESSERELSEVFA